MDNHLLIGLIASGIVVCFFIFKAQKDGVNLLIVCIGVLAILAVCTQWTSIAAFASTLLPSLHAHAQIVQPAASAVHHTHTITHSVMTKSHVLEEQLTALPPTSNFAIITQRFVVAIAEVGSAVFLAITLVVCLLLTFTRRRQKAAHLSHYAHGKTLK